MKKRNKVLQSLAVWEPYQVQTLSGIIMGGNDDPDKTDPNGGPTGGGGPPESTVPPPLT